MRSLLSPMLGILGGRLREVRLKLRLLNVEYAEKQFLKLSLALWSRVLTVESYSKKIRRSDNASLAHFTFTPHSTEDKMLDTKIVGLLSRLNVVRYLRNNHRVVRKMKRYQIGNRVLTRRRQRLVQVLFPEPIRIQDLRQLRVFWSNTNASLAHITFELVSVWQSTPTVSFQFPFLWIADGATCKTGLSSRSSLINTTADTRTLK